jgi:hypothetical protein
MSKKSISSSRGFFAVILIPGILVISPVKANLNRPWYRYEDSTENHARRQEACQKSQNVRILFYNVENLYDPFDDTTKLDNEFTPDGGKHWNYDRFFTKLQHLAKVFIAAGGWEPPAIIGMCEVENRFVLRKLVSETPLKKYGYRILHYDSPDARGVDVAMIYRPDIFSCAEAKQVPVRFPFDSAAATRDILMVKGSLPGGDTLFLFINHWPSRRGGYEATKGKRNFTGRLLRSKTDSLFRKDTRCRIIIMGDLNDEPDKESIRVHLGARCDTAGLKSCELVNLMCTGRKNFPGTIKYQGQWSVFDQFIVSGSLLDPEARYHTSPGDARIFAEPFLLEADDRYSGSRIRRTYTGPAYKGGFSDHLPVILDLTVMQVK